VGRVLGHYRLLEQIGAGGMGVVYRAHDEHLDRNVAIKVLPPGTLADDAARKRFRKEALALSKLNHPNIAIIHDFDTQGGTDFLVMELVSGVTLNEKLLGGALEEKDVVGLGLQLAEGLAAAHSEGVVHLDLKPRNLRIAVDGRLKILDFGLAKLIELPGEAETESLTRVGVGTLPYMAPEQLRGGLVDGRTDVWAAGVVLYELSTGRPPFQERVSTAVADAILHKIPLSPGRKVPAMSARLEDIIMKCLEKDPARRYQASKELLVDLTRLGAPSRISMAAATRARIRRLATVVLSLLVMAGVLLGALAVVRRRTASTDPVRITSLAVLPLANRSGDREQEYFADGMTEQLIAELAQISALRVISRTSAMHYKGSDRRLPDIARELQVDAVVEGSVERSGERVRITVQLISARTDQPLWTKNYQRDLRDVLDLQSEVAGAIAQEIKVKLTPREEARLAGGRRMDPKAYQLYLRGRYHWNQRTEEDLDKALDYFQQARETDPSSPLPYAGLADTYVILASYFRSPEKAYPLARASAEKALALDETLAEPHAALASYRWGYEWDWADSLREYQQSIALNPSYATAHQWYAESLVRLGRHREAIEEIEKAKALDPLSRVISAVHGYIYYYARQYDRAIVEGQKGLDLDPNFYLGHLFLGWAYEQKGMLREAIAKYQKAMSLPGGNTPEVQASLAHAYARSGRNAEARAILAKVKEQSRQRRTYVDPYYLSVIHAGLDERAQALSRLEEAYQQHSEVLTFVAVDPRFDGLRSDRRFQDLLQRMRLPQ
jgi:serine/threonine-protein kinase